MVEHQWADNVRFIQFTPTTIHYDLELDAFYVARADIRSTDQRHRLGLVIAVTARDLAVNRLTVHEAIVWGRGMLERLIPAHRDIPDSLTATEVRVFNFSGERVR
jgi:hypothetical protein